VSLLINKLVVRIIMPNFYIFIVFIALALTFTHTHTHTHMQRAGGKLEPNFVT
jgi:hypothetical protein